MKAIYRLVKTLLTLLIICVSYTAFSQKRCATVEYSQDLTLKFPRLEQKQSFEEWLRKRSSLQKQNNRQQRTQEEPYQIPVVVHIIHNANEEVGEGKNIPDEQILSQLNVLNNDFNRLNTDAAQTPLEFAPVAGSIDIQFILARQDPSGNPTTGIVRVAGSKTSWNRNDDALLKSQSYWPSEDYLNVWVCNLSSDYGYAQFPISDLAGLEDFQDEMALTDGVVVAYDAFGSIDDGNFNLESNFDKGRTLTHEVGHFFGLRHIWGDDSNCNSTTDYVADTPKQNNDTSGCPTHPQTSCGNIKMFQNFMDYTYDQCMNLFTTGQADRMKIVLENSIRRVSLLTSHGLISLPCENENISLLTIINPQPVSCAGSSDLTFQVKNNGCFPIASLRVAVSIDNKSPLITELVVPPISIGNTRILNLPLSLTEGEHTIDVSLDMPNGGIDMFMNDNTLTKKVIINSVTEELPARERFDNFFTDRWSVVNPASELSWQTVNTNYNFSLGFPLQTHSQKQTTWLVSPILDYSNLTQASMRLDWSYKNNIGNPTQVELKYTTDCGTTYKNLSGFLLQETTRFSGDPQKEEDWETQVIDLTSLGGENNVRIAFVASSSNGNPVYLDNIEFYTGAASPKLAAEEVFAVYPAEDGGTNVTFNISSIQTAEISVLNTLGKSVLQTTKNKVLNQTFTVQLPGLQTGIYIVRIKADNQYYSQKVFIPGQ